MNCREFDARLHAFVDGELDAGPMADAEAHVSTCPDCHGRADGERRFRQLLRRQPKEAAPPEFRARMLALARRERTRTQARIWLGTPALAAAVLLLAFVLIARSLLTGGREPELVASLVDKHLAYAQLEGPAEFSSTERPAVAAGSASAPASECLYPTSHPRGSSWSARASRRPTSTRSPISCMRKATS
jgi:anti-sigma factor (TIGR02949 family)